MRLSWQQLIRKKLQGRSKFYSVGIAFSAEGISLCGLKKEPRGLRWELDAGLSHTNWQAQLATFVKNYELSGAPCHVALTSHHYQVLQIDRPDVPDAEVHDALAWQVQQLLPSNQEYAYDFAEQPVQVSGQNKVIVVAIPKKDIQAISEGIFEADLDLRSIIIEETAAVELTPYSDEATLTLVQEHGEEIVLNIVKDGRLYFSRRLKGFENLGTYSMEELEMGIIDTLCVQLQRSMDFFESQLRQAPVQQILIKLDTSLPLTIINGIQDAMDINTAEFVPALSCAQHLDFKMASFSCLGAAYSPFALANSK